jgi:hypothetical protein
MRCVRAMMCVPVDCGLSSLTGGELALEKNSYLFPGPPSPNPREPFLPHYGGCSI